MFEELERINSRPEPFGVYTAGELWTDEHTSGRMLRFHLDGGVDVASRRTEFVDRSVAWIGSRFPLGPGFRVADFGCGPGLYAARLARRGAEVTGIDFSGRSIRHAQAAALREGLSIGYVQQDYLTFETDRRFHLILMIMCDFCALSPAQRKTMSAKFHSLLEPGGRILLDVYSLAAFDQRGEAALYERNLLDGFWSASPYHGFQNTFKYEKEKVVLDKFTIVESDRTRTIYNWLQYFSPESLREEFAACELETEELFSDVAGSPYRREALEFAVLAKRT